ncbi:DUF4870 family protein [Glaciecola siphonariae]|uniref:DUF4870 family protein n=1 Tax=Glaciecola siphonariae TaxID=521012 RepID=A0ABV9LY05_9ALTE
MTDPVLETKDDTSSMAKLVYILYLASIIVGLTGIIGVVIAYIKKNDSPEWLRSHFQFQIRTFWIGFLYIFIGSLLMLVLVGYLVLIFFVVWLIIRSVKGFLLIDKKQAHPNPTSWFF